MRYAIDDLVMERESQSEQGMPIRGTYAVQR